MRALLLACLGVCSLALTGCKAVYTVNPLYTNEDAVEEPALEGVWTGGDNDHTQLCIQRSDGHAYSLIVSEPDSKITQIFQINLVQLDHQLYADMVFQKQTVDRTEAELPLGTITNHVILKLDVADDDLAYSILDYSVIRGLDKEGYPPLDFLDGDEVLLLTTSTDDLRQYITVYGDHLFTDSDHYTREVSEDAGSSPTTTCPVPTPP